MNKILRQYPYGFAFSDVYLDSLPESYNLTRILDKFNYYHDTYSNAYQTETDFIIIHGHFKHVSIGGQQSIHNDQLPAYLLEQYGKNYSEFLETLNFIGGRYVIIIGNAYKVEVYPDACACRSAYYTTDKNIIASHLEMIVDNFNYKKDPVVRELPKLGFTLNISPYLNIKSMLPNILLNFFTKETVRFFPTCDNSYNNLTDDEKLNEVEDLWKQQLKYYTDNYNNLLFSLTAGNDSRVSFSLVREYREKIKFFTYSPKNLSTNDEGSYFIKSLTIDNLVVKQILKDIDINHKFIYFSNEDNNFTEKELKILSKNSIKGHGRFLINHYTNNFKEQDIMHIRANLLEIGRAYYLKLDRLNHIKSVKNIFDNSFKSSKYKINKEMLDNIFSESINEMYYEELFDYHILDLYYWENRMGRWFSEVLNETDSAFETFLPFNLRAIIDLSLSFGIKKRREDYMFKELINRNDPILNFYGINNIKNIYEQTKIDKEKEFDFFEEFEVYDNTSNLIVRESSQYNLLYIPVRFLKENHYSKIKFIFEETVGCMSLSVISTYLSMKAKGYLVYQISINNKVVLEEDMSFWNLENIVYLFGLNKGDIISIEVKSLRNIQIESWQTASRLQILNCKSLLLETIVSRKITCTSPFSKIFDY